MKIYVQLDVQNLFYSARSVGKRLDFRKIRKYFSKSGDKVVGLNAYTVHTPDINSDKFENLLKTLGYNVSSKKATTVYNKDGTAHYLDTDQDMSICIDCMSNINKFDKWVLMSGDGDFIDLIKHLKNLGKKVEVWAVPGKSFNKRICDYADSIKFLSDDFFYTKKER